MGPLSAGETKCEEACVCEGDAPLRLFATHTCPNCAQAEKVLSDAGILYEKVYAEENKALARKYGIMQAPTLVEELDGEVKKYRGVGEIIAFAESTK